MSDHKRDEFDDLISFFQLNDAKDQPEGASAPSGRGADAGSGQKGQADGTDDFPVYPPLEKEKSSASGRDWESSAAEQKTDFQAGSSSGGLDGDDDLFNMEDLTQKLSKRDREQKKVSSAASSDSAGKPGSSSVPDERKASQGSAVKPVATPQPAAVSSPPQAGAEKAGSPLQPKAEDFQMHLPDSLFLDGDDSLAGASAAGEQAAPQEKDSPTGGMLFDGGDGGKDEESRENSGAEGGNRGGGGTDSSTRKRGGGRGGRFFRAMICVLIVLALSGFLSIFLLESANDLLGFNKEDTQIEVVIPENAQLKEISDILSEEGVISQPLTFQIYAKLRKMADSFQPGTYLLNSNMSYDEIMLALKNATNVTETIRLTFPEGMSLYEIAQMLEENKVCDAQAFIDVLQTGEFDYEFIQMLPDDELRFYRLEGYIFPDTYDFFIGEKPISVAKKFLDAFNSRVTSDLYDRMRDLNMTLDEAITLASIIQKEASSAEEMYMVSSVFHNRLERAEFPSRMLQSDVTVHYVENFIKPRLDIENQPMYDAYNTYACVGLPVGPICSPGLDAIDAALYPDSSDYFYFLTDKNGKYYYAQTGEEHYRNEREAESVGGVDHGTDTQ